MNAEPLTVEVSNRICHHMNEDHLDAVLAYAKHYGGAIDPSQVEMVEVTPKDMELKVDGARVRIPFNHTLIDSKDAHRTLVAMLQAMPRNKI